MWMILVLVIIIIIIFYEVRNFDVTALCERVPQGVMKSLIFDAILEILISEEFRQRIHLLWMI